MTICIILSSCLCITNSHAQTLTYRQINEEILFAPEFEAYKYGRRTDENGVGKIQLQTEEPKTFKKDIWEEVSAGGEWSTHYFAYIPEK